MKFALTVLCPPHSDTALRALRFAQACAAKGHKVSQIFFYQDGVYHANRLASPPQDETNLVALWQAFKSEHGAELCVCVASTIRRGVMDAAEAKRHGLDQHNLAEGFEIVGLGQLMSAKQSSDRLVTFG